MSGWDQPGRGKFLWVLVLVLAGLAFLTVESLSVPIPYLGDEGMWISSGKYEFQKMFLERDFRSESWSRQYGNFGRLSPPVGKYIIGASLFLHGVVDTTTDLPNHGPYVSWGRAQDNEPPPEVLAAGRAPMPWIFVGSVILLFFVARELAGSWLVGVLAAALYVIRPLSLVFTDMAMLETPLVFFCLAGLLVAARYLLKPDDERAATRRRFVYGAGLLCGIAWATKLNALVVPATIAVWLAYDVLVTGAIRRGTGETFRQAWRRRVRDQRPWHILRSAALTMYIVFLVINPRVLHQPVRQPTRMLKHGRTISRYETPFHMRLNTVGKRLIEPIRMGLGRYGALDRRLGWSWGDELLALLGVVVCVFLGIRAPDDHRTRGFGLALLWLVVTYLLIVATAPFNWPRWYVPLEPCWAILQAIGVSGLLYGAAAVTRRRAGSRAPGSV